MYCMQVPVFYFYCRTDGVVTLEYVIKTNDLNNQTVLYLNLTLYDKLPKVTVNVYDAAFDDVGISIDMPRVSL